MAGMNEKGYVSNKALDTYKTTYTENSIEELREWLVDLREEEMKIHILEKPIRNTKQRVRLMGRILKVKDRLVILKHTLAPEANLNCIDS